VSAPEDLLETAPCGFLSFSDDGTITRANRTLHEILGYAPGELAGSRVEQLLTLGTRIFYQTHWFPLLRLHGYAEEIFLMFRSRTGEEIGAIVNAVRRERGGSFANDCIVIRVRERQKYEEELLRARRVADAARAEAETQKREVERANAVLEAQTVELEAQQAQLEEQALELEVASDELRTLNDELLVRSEEAERLRAAADEANQAKSGFLAVMSHELRTPLNAIGGYVQLLELGIHGPVTAAQLEALERISRGQRHLLRLIGEVLDFARIEAGHVEYDLETAPAAELLAAVLPMIEPQAEQKRIALSSEVARQLLVRADREKAQQILLNLLSNAVKFTPSGGSVRVSAAPSLHAPGHLCLSVSDTGIGIPPERLAAVFQPFVQVGPSHASRAEGTGLGLAISRDLARGMDGDLVVESTPGEGSTFTLILPEGVADPGAATPAVEGGR
jgi:PAS domain S-box-containing protein